VHLRDWMMRTFPNEAPERAWSALSWQRAECLSTKNGRAHLQHLQAARTPLAGAAGLSPYHCARWRRREWLRPLRFIFVVIVIVVGAAFVIVGINIPAPRSGRTLFVIIVIVVIHRRDGLRRVRFE
jgi:hypothetical protein